MPNASAVDAMGVKSGMLSSFNRGRGRDCARESESTRARDASDRIGSDYMDCIRIAEHQN